MKVFLRLSLSLLIATAASNLSWAAVVDCRGDGTTDVTVCLQNAANSAANGKLQVLLGYGTYLISATIIVPNGVQFIGIGRGDQNFVGTVLRASNSFPLHGTMVSMAYPGVNNVHVVVKGMTIDG